MITVDEAMEGVNKWNLLPFFERYTAEDRLEIADILIRMIGGKDLWYGQTLTEEVYESNGAIYGHPKRTGGVRFTPAMRLRWVIQSVTEDIGRWPEDGIAGIRAFYCYHFAPADGKEPTAWSDTQDKVAPPLPPAPPQRYLPAPGDEPVGDLKALVAVGAKKLGGSR